MSWCDDEDGSKFSDLYGKTITKIEGLEKGSEKVLITTDDPATYVMWHEKDWFEQVSVEDVCGDVEDLLGSPVLLAEEVSQKGENPEGYEPPEWQDASFTWTFYKLSTIRGSVTIRWYGESNGYYSERVDFKRVDQ